MHRHILPMHDATASLKSDTVLSLTAQCTVIGAGRHTAPVKLRCVQFAFSQTEKPATQLKLT